ncbi:uncharacterized protein LOC103865123 isoform X2 [Brassica rapa]|uniref:uncharacterized protein LOC103865123 isoform X2 n=1 Tax=Brassica campestris TaxID=3711 RepID=UPI00142DF502|nr:uncharacterized protein LOC103865123 isoform X2 [Brassica rapa]
MGGVMQKFLVASMFMWILPVAILYGFNNDLLPGFEIELNPENHYLKKLGRMFKLFLLGGTCARFNNIFSAFSNTTEWISCCGISQCSDCVLHLPGPERTYR